MMDSIIYFHFIFTHGMASILSINSFLTDPNTRYTWAGPAGPQTRFAVQPASGDHLSPRVGRDSVRTRRYTPWYCPNTRHICHGLRARTGRAPNWEHRPAKKGNTESRDSIVRSSESMGHFRNSAFWVNRVPGTLIELVNRVRILYNRPKLIS